MVGPYGISINALPLVQYSLDCPLLNTIKEKRISELISSTWIAEDISPTTSLGMKMVHNQAHLLHTWEDAFIIENSYMGIYLSCCMFKAKGGEHSIQT